MTDTATLIQSLRVLARDIDSRDGVANAAIAEAADRMEELEHALHMLYAFTSRSDESVDAFVNAGEILLRGKL